LPWSDPEKAARKLLEIANAVDAVQDGRIYIELKRALPVSGARNAGRIQNTCGRLWPSKMCAAI
jgi:hypothetical protein